MRDSRARGPAPARPLIRPLAGAGAGQSGRRRADPGHIPATAARLPGDVRQRRGEEAGRAKCVRGEGVQGGWGAGACLRLRIGCLGAHGRPKAGHPPRPLMPHPPSPASLPQFRSFVHTHTHTHTHTDAHVHIIAGRAARS